MEQPGTEDTLRKDDARSPQQRAENVAYTINHAFACTATDLAGGSPYIGSRIARFLSRFTHSHDSVGEWFLSEGIGDFAAVPATIVIENHAPGLANAERKTMESVLGWAFRRSARREAAAWAKSRDLAPDSEAAKQEEQRIYRYEIKHLSQVVNWTATSFAFNIATLMAFDKYVHHGHKHSHGGCTHGEPQKAWKLGVGLLGGKLFSTGLVVGARAAFPDKAHQWDNFAARKVFAPATKQVSKLFGITPKAADKAEEKREKAYDSWESRLKTSPADAAAPLR